MCSVSGARRPAPPGGRNQREHGRGPAGIHVETRGSALEERVVAPTSRQARIRPRMR